MIPKFRAWIKFNNWDKMIYDFQLEINKNENRFLMPCGWGDLKYLKDYEYELMQSTGFKDKKGVEMFEGDIVNDTLFGDNLEIKWYKNYNCWIFGKIALSKERAKNLEVIGNIYENPELLENNYE